MIKFTFFNNYCKKNKIQTFNFVFTLHTEHYSNIKKKLKPDIHLQIYSNKYTMINMLNKTSLALNKIF